MSDWHPIETAPKDGRRFIAFSPMYGVTAAHFDSTSGMINLHSCLYQDAEVTHWMELPAPPSQ